MKQLSLLGVPISIISMFFTVIYLPSDLTRMGYFVLLGTPIYFLLFSTIAIRESFKKKSKNDYFL